MERKRNPGCAIEGRYRVTIEQTFEALFNLVLDLDGEESRAIREGLDEESLAIFDLLRKPDLNATEIKRIKVVSVQLLEQLKSEKIKVDHWRDKEATHDAVRVTIFDRLWDENSGLPVEAFADADVKEKAEDVFRHSGNRRPQVQSLHHGYSSTRSCHDTRRHVDRRVW